MTRARLVSIFAGRETPGRAVFTALALLCLVAAPSISRAQDAGVSGIPPGPANARGLNGSVSDPSGIGNAARMPSLPQPSIAPVTPPSVSPPLSSSRTFTPQRVVRFRRTRVATPRMRRAAARTAVRERGAPIDRGVPSICRGC